MVRYSTPAYRDSEDDDQGGHQLKILSPLPRVPWDLPPLPSGAGAGASPPSVRQCQHDPQDVRHEAATYRRTCSQKRRSVDDAKDYTQRPVGEERERSLSSSQGSRPARLSVSRHEAAPYLVGNPFILSGYRRCITLREACQGLFYQHNSWLDTWTSVFSWVHSHVLLFVASYIYGVFRRDWLSAIVFASFYLHVAWIHAPASIVCHLVGNAGISQHVYELCLELDYLGIFIASVILAFTQAVFVYPWWGTLLNVLLAMGLTAYLVRPEGGEQEKKEGMGSGAGDTQPSVPEGNQRGCIRIEKIKRRRHVA